MAKYIDAEKLKSTLIKNIYPSSRCGKTFNSLLEFVMRLIDAMPAADVVAVVRCKDCKFADPYMTYDGVEMHLCDNLGVSGLEPCDFCSYGERKSR